MPGAIPVIQPTASKNKGCIHLQSALQTAISEWVNNFLTAHQHIIVNSGPWKARWEYNKVISNKWWNNNQNNPFNGPLSRTTWVRRYQKNIQSVTPCLCDWYKYIINFLNFLQSIASSCIVVGSILYIIFPRVCLCALTLYPATDCAAATDISGATGCWQLSHYSVLRLSRQAYQFTHIRQRCTRPWTDGCLHWLGSPNKQAGAACVQQQCARLNRTGLAGPPQD